MTLTKGSWSTLALLACLALFARPSQAEAIACPGSQQDPQVICSTTQTVIGSSLSIFAFTIETAGDYDLSLLDYEFPTASLDTVTLTVTRSTEELAYLEGPGSLTFFASPGTYFAQVFALADLNAGIGLYGFQVYNPVPLPASLVLLLSSFGLFGWLRWRRSPKGSEAQANL